MHTHLYERSEKLRSLLRGSSIFRSHALAEARLLSFEEGNFSEVQNKGGPDEAALKKERAEALHKQTGGYGLDRQAEADHIAITSNRRTFDNGPVTVQETVRLLSARMDLGDQLVRAGVTASVGDSYGAYGRTTVDLRLSGRLIGRITYTSRTSTEGVTYRLTGATHIVTAVYFLNVNNQRVSREGFRKLLLEAVSPEQKKKIVEEHQKQNSQDRTARAALADEIDRKQAEDIPPRETFPPRAA